MDRRRALAIGVAVLALAATVNSTPAAADVRPGAAPRPGVAPAPGRDPVVTLITGDRVHLVDRGSGDVAVAVEAGPGRAEIGFSRRTRLGPHGIQISVLPSDAAPLVATGRLDPRLFDVTELVRQGLTDAGSPTLPLIVTYRSTAARTLNAPRAATTARALPSINGTALRQDRRHGGEFWSWLTGTRATDTRATVNAATLNAATLNADIGKVWLDSIAQPTLDVSVPQIGAPTAWQAGLTGVGVTVGILDTGVKADHPDLAGKVIEQRDFTDSLPDGGDDVGHGTHVASIIAGTGAASNGRFRGVAPDAKLISGKVCMFFGCPDSAIIAGMEWIAPQVRVVNMSLGGGSTDGTDPVSQAVNNLTAQHGTLFVISAGNSRGLDQVAAPAAADAALAVGSVTKQDATSDFSSAGPRAGDFAVKPDIAAPGTSITAARAAGTPAGDAQPFDDNYATLSGTSMAAPHVSGAAAILVQQHPGWNADRLKPTLMSTAKPTAGVYDQGAGRVDVARAVTQPVTTTGGSLSFGFFAWPHNQQPVTRQVTYRNDSDADVTLSLTLAATGADGQPAPAGLFTLSAAQLTVPAHGTAGAAVTATPSPGVVGLFGGRVSATAPGVSVQTALGAFLEPESFNVTVTLVSRTGQPFDQFGQLVNAVTGDVFPIFRFDADGKAVVRVPKGRYDVDAVDFSRDPTNPDQPFALTVLARPNLDVSADRAVTLDATAGQPVTVVADRTDAVRQAGELGLLSTNAAGTAGGSVSFSAQRSFQLFAVATGRKVTDHSFAMFLRATLAAARPGTDPSGFVYQLGFLERGRIPANTTFRVRDRELATVDARYLTQGAESTGTRGDSIRFAVPGLGGGFFQFYNHTLPSRRTELYSAGPDVSYLHLLIVGAAGSFDSEVIFSVRSYRSGPQRSSWNRAPLGPAFGDPGLRWGVVRAGKQLNVAVTLLSGNDRDQFTTPPDAMTGTTTLSRDGTVLGTSARPGIGQFPIPDSAGTYTLRATATRDVPWSVVGTAADVTWTFREPGAAAAIKPVPLLVVRASGEVDDQGRAPAGCVYVLSLTAQRQPGAPAIRLERLRVEASFDDGATWTDARTVRAGEGGFALVHHPTAAGFVSLRITARDARGNTVTQTVIRAYQTASRPAG
jgi:subtilisin family serine protease